MRLIAEAPEEDAAAGVDAVIRQGRTTAHIEHTDAAAGVTTELDAIDAGAAGAGIDIEVGARIARHQTGTPGVTEARIGTGEEAAEPALQRGSIAVAVGMAPTTEAQRP